MATRPLSERRDGHSLDASTSTVGRAGETGTLPAGWVKLPSGRTLNLRRWRWDGVLDREEFEYCRQHGIPLGYDCAQIGWVTMASTNEWNRNAKPMPAASADARVAPAGPEHSSLALRGSVAAEADRLLKKVREGRASLEHAQSELAAAAATALPAFAEQWGLSKADQCHWSLQSVVARALGGVRGPLHESPSPSDVAAFTFRSWTPHDAASYRELLGNPRVWEYLPEPFPSPFTEDTARTLIEVGAIGFHHETLAVETAGRAVGQCLLRFDQPFDDARACEVAYWLGEEHWGQGLMSRILPVFTYRSLCLHRVDVIYAWIRADNVASIRVAERAGYQRDAFPLETRIADRLRRPGFIRYATYRADWRIPRDSQPMTGSEAE